MMTNLFSLQVDGCRLPDFPRITDDDWQPAFDRAMAAQKEALEQIATDESPATVDLIRRWELSGVDLTTVSNAFWTAKDADTSEQRDEIEAVVSPQLTRHADSIQLDRRLYDRLVELQRRIDDGEVTADAQDAWWLSEELRGFRRAGVALSATDQERLRAINEQIATLEAAYSSLVVKGRARAAVHITDLARLAGLNADQLTAAKSAADTRGLDGWVIELVNTTRQPILASLDDRDTRREVFEASIGRGRSGEGDVRDTILSLARLRDEKARLLGFDHYAAYVADDGCAKTTSNVMALLTKAAAAATANAQREAAQLQEQLDEWVPGATLQPWDWQWLAEKTRKAQFDLDDAALAPYLRFETVLEKGVFAAAHRLYGLTFHRRDDIAGYTPECVTYEVRDASTSVAPMGMIQIDAYARPSKQGGAWMTSLTEQGLLTGDRPVVTNNLNHSRPAPGQPSLITWDQVTTVFHEFGHALHALLAHTRYPSMSGTNTPQDFVEFPSQVNEMWAWGPSVIAGFARHVDTDEPMPPQVLDTLLAARSFGQGYDAVETFAAMLLDQVWHQTGAADLPTSVDGIDAFEREALARFGMDVPLIPPRYRSCYFSHIWGPGYAAGYYGYLWAEVMDADTVAWFGENGGLTRENGDWFAREVLSRGGSEDVMEAYRRFRGADPDPIHLFRRRGLV
ncbi:MAG: M3 family metallopeptidase [Propionibacteriaceae bacterium]|nr:M3 family metallopeptidase [Propionibacteriaceae bacterium]